MTRPFVWIGIVALLALGSSACATKGDLEVLNAKLDRMEATSARAYKQAEAAEQRAIAAEREATQAVRRAEDAAARAVGAQTSADVAARKSEAIFNKSVSK